MGDFVETLVETKISLDSVYVPSGDVVAREIEGEIIIVPLTSGIGDMDDELYALNDTGKAIWQKLDGKRNLKTLIEELSAEFEATAEEMKGDVTGFLGELLRRGMILEA